MLSCKNLLLRSKKRKQTRTKTPKKLKKSPDEVEESGEDGNFNLKNSRSILVQPLGNLYLNTKTNTNSRNTGLGNLRTLTDELVLEILAFLNGTDLGVLSSVSKSFYVFSNHDPLWRTLVLDTCQGDFVFYDNWKNTFVRTHFQLPCYGNNNNNAASLRINDFYSDYLFQSWLCANLEMKQEWLQRDNICRREGISVDEFVSEFEEPNKPVLLQGCLDNWPAIEKWDREYLVRVCGDDVKFAVGPVEMKLRDFLVYSDRAREERPLYLFDPKFADKVPQLGMDYVVPEYFNEDLFSVLGDERPDYRWIIIGPAGSGSSFHIDPNSTSAWNAVIRGSKKWVLFPPDVVPPGVHPSPDGAEVACPVSIMEWFMNFYNDTKTWKRRPVECVCKAGEVIFVPNGWWHLVINLEDSVAITQNYVSRRNLVNVLDFLKKPNASTLVSGTRDRVSLHDKFKNAIETSIPRTLDQLMMLAEEKKKQQSKPTFWESVIDSKEIMRKVVC